MRKMVFKKNGYTLIELAIAITIIASLLSALLVVLQTQTAPDKEKDTIIKIERIHAAIKTFYNQNGYIPCPSPGKSLQSDTAFGRAGTFTVGTKVCNPDSADLANNVGMVPVRDLKLDDEFAFDGWNRKFSYRVATGLGSASYFSNNVFPIDDIYKGDIKVIDLTGVELTKTNDVPPYNYGAAYVLISHGTDGSGAFAKNNNAAAVNPPANAVTGVLDYQNANIYNNKTYIYARNNQALNDIVSYRTKLDFQPILKGESPLIVPDYVCSEAGYVSERLVPPSATLTGGLKLFTFESLISGFSNSFYRYARAVNQMCQNPPSYSMCSLTPYQVKSGNIVAWYDMTDPSQTGGPYTNNQTISTLISKVVNPVTGSRTNLPASATLPVYRTTTPFPSYTVSTGGFALTTPRTAMYFGSNASFTSFTTGTLNTLFGTSSLNNFTIFIVDLVDLTGNTVVQQPYYSFSTNTAVSNQSLFLGRGITGGAGNPPFAYSQVNNDIVIPGSSVQDKMMPTIYSITFNGSYGADTTYPYGTKVLTVRTLDGNKYVGTSNDNTAISPTSATYTIGSNSVYSPNNFKGWIGEIIIYNTALSADERAQVESYLARRWFSAECN